MKRLGVVAALLLSAGTVGATIDTKLVETKEVSNSAEFIQALQDAAATNALYTYGKYFCTFKLHPGVYDVSALAMDAKYHIYLPTFYCGQMLGLGEKPGDVVITGGGAAAADPKSVMWVSSGSFQSFVVSNLTVTGGYGGAAGGGINGGYTTLTKIKDCIITNNYSPSQGGGVYRATIERCLIRDNSAETRGGGVTAALCSDCEIVSNHVTVSTMLSTGGGGASDGSRLTRCVLKGNTSTAGGGGALDSSAVDCVFDGNDCSASGYGGQVFRGAYTNCVFRNSDSRKGMKSVHATVSYRANLVDCVISNVYCTNTLIEDGNLTRCRYTDNESTLNDGQISGDASKYSIVNSVFDHNRALSGRAASLFNGCNVVNCTIADNSFYATNTRFGALGIQGRRVNCVCAGNSPADYSYEAGNAPVMTNTYWVTQRTAPPEGFCSGGGQVANLYLKHDGDFPYLPRKSSPAHNGGYSDETILQQVGSTDYYGRPRVARGRLDAGAVERQLEDDTGLIIQYR